MSRSYKKTAVVKDHDSRLTPHHRKGKTIASRTVRRTDIKLDGGLYKKLFCSYNISDYAFYMTEEDFRREWENGSGWLGRRYRTYKEAYRKWYVTYKGK